MNQIARNEVNLLYLISRSFPVELWTILRIWMTTSIQVCVVSIISQVKHKSILTKPHQVSQVVPELGHSSAPACFSIIPSLRLSLKHACKFAHTHACKHVLQYTCKNLFKQVLKHVCKHFCKYMGGPMEAYVAFIYFMVSF